MAMFRRISQALLRRSSVAQRQLSAASAHGEQTAKTWKTLSFLVALPGVAVCQLNMYLRREEHHSHYEQPEFIAYPYRCIRTKPFPWGDGTRTLFHNPQVNPLPDGYEELDN